MIRKIGIASNYTVAFVALIAGFIYLFKPTFMPYHHSAIGLEWSQIDPSVRYLILALMRAIGGGYLACAITIFFLQFKFAVQKSSWIPLLILVCGLIVAITSVYATLILRIYTPGNPPTAFIISIILLLMLGYAGNLADLNGKQS
jgi:hypothetical protein